ncbi:MAG: hypothetical protein IKT78_01795, partial [Ruminiclostridium sp.]|nr:hypothetical protein [Ruminiclostridium sp.]
MLKKIISAILICAMAVTFTGCADNITTGCDDTMPQCDPANISHQSMLNQEYATMKGTEGYYYTELPSDKHNLTVFYYDINAKESIPLCAKPQCLHDGNAFCVATGGKFIVYTLFYNNYIYKLCYENAEGEMYAYKLLRGDMQGNELSVVSEIFTAPIEQQIDIANVFCHYGMMFFAVKKYNGKKFTNHIYTINLSSGVVKEIEVPDATKYERFPYMTADGDYLYIATEDEITAENQSWNKIDADTVMHRYNLKTSEIEVISALPKIYSSFTACDGIIYYTTENRSDNTFSLVFYDTEKKETGNLVENKQMVYMDDKFISGNGAKVVTDRKYLYISMPCGSGFAEATDKRGMELYVYDMDGKQLYEGVLSAKESKDSE